MARRTAGAAAVETAVAGAAAPKDIEEGDVIFTEEPFVVGARSDEDGDGDGGSLICHMCGTHLPELNAQVLSGVNINTNFTTATAIATAIATAAKAAAECVTAFHHSRRCRMCYHLPPPSPTHPPTHRASTTSTPSHSSRWRRVGSPARRCSLLRPPRTVGKSGPR